MEWIKKGEFAYPNQVAISKTETYSLLYFPPGISEKNLYNGKDTLMYQYRQ